MDLPVAATRIKKLFPRLARFATVLSGDGSCFDLEDPDFLQYLAFQLDKTELNDRDFSAHMFATVYAYWLSKVEKGVLKPVIQKHGADVFQPGVFADSLNGMELETGAYLVGLAPQQRAALLLVTAEGFSYHQVAHILKVSSETVNDDVATARGILAGGRYTAHRGLLKNQGLHQNVLPQNLTRQKVTGLTGT